LKWTTFRNQRGSYHRGHRSSHYCTKTKNQGSFQTKRGKGNILFVSL